MRQCGFPSMEEGEKYAKRQYGEEEDSPCILEKDPSTGLLHYGSRLPNGGVLVCWGKGLGGMELIMGHGSFSSSEEAKIYEVLQM